MEQIVKHSGHWCIIKTLLQQFLVEQNRNTDNIVSSKETIGSIWPKFNIFSSTKYCLLLHFSKKSGQHQCFYACVVYHHVYLCVVYHRVNAWLVYHRVCPMEILKLTNQFPICDEVSLKKQLPTRDRLNISAKPKNPRNRI